MKSIVWQQLTWFDFTLIGVIALSIIISLFRGFIREVISLIIWIVAIVLALKFSVDVSHYFKPYIDSDALRYIFSFVILFIAALVVGAIINWLAKVLVSKVGMTLIDRMLGVIFGGARGILAVSVILLLVQMSPLQKKVWWENSQLPPHFDVIVTWMKQFAPEKINQVSKWISNEIMMTEGHLQNQSSEPPQSFSSETTPAPDKKVAHSPHSEGI